MSGIHKVFVYTADTLKDLINQFSLAWPVVLCQIVWEENVEWDWAAESIVKYSLDLKSSFTGFFKILVKELSWTH